MVHWHWSDVLRLIYTIKVSHQSPWSKFDQRSNHSGSKFLIALSRFWREILITMSYLQDNRSFWWAVICFCVLYLGQVMRKRVLCHMRTRRAQISLRIRITCYSRNFKPLASLCSRAGQFESNLVENPEDTFSRDVAHFVLHDYQKFGVRLWTSDWLHHRPQSSAYRYHATSLQELTQLILQCFLPRVCVYLFTFTRINFVSGFWLAMSIKLWLK